MNFSLKTGPLSQKGTLGPNEIYLADEGRMFITDTLSSEQEFNLSAFVNGIVDSEIIQALSTSPQILASLQQLAAAIAVDPSIANTVLSTKVDNNDLRLADERTPSDGSVTFLKLISGMNEWLKAYGYETDSEPISRHRYMPNNYAVLDANNHYHQMVEINRKNWDATNGFAAATIHDAFIVGGVQGRLMLGKVPATNDWIGKPVSWMNRIPMTNNSFDQELALVSALNNGGTITGFHDMTIVEWALLMQIIKNSGVTVLGNNNWGQDINDKMITFRLGVPAAFADHASDGRHYTGSGGNLTSHNNENDGIFDLTGGVWQRLAGCRIVNGEIQIFDKNNAANHQLDQSDASLSYLSILEDGTLVSPGTANTLKYSVNGNITKAVPAPVNSSKPFNAIGCEPDVNSSSNGIALLKKLGLYPYTTSMGGTFWFNTAGTFVPFRGADWGNAANAAVPALNCNNTRSSANSNIGFRVAFWSPL